ncbi:MAG: LysR family transcriptional regulator [Oscillospiraceae bacterium]|jgi:DNA-binding transcriptional LysR family regulator|nr:LysR family transcriptional regulator [Oscillospiraceae bacterium]
MNFSQIKCFLAAAECGSFTRAADRIYISQSVLSRQIAAMEEELGIELFTRGKKAVRLTPAGAVMSAGLSELAAAYHTLVGRAAALHQGYSGSLNIGMIEGQLICPPYSDALTSFRARCSDVRVNLTQHSMAALRRALLEGEVDIGFGAEFNAENTPELDYIRVGVAETLLVIPKTHPLAGRGDLHLEDFRNDTFLTLSENEAPYIADAPRRIRDGKFAPKSLTAQSIGALALWLEAGFGIFPLNENHSLRNNPNLLFVPIPELSPSIEVVMWRRDSQNPIVHAFLEEFEERKP